MALKIITDSAADLPRYIIDEFDLHVIPTPVVIEGKDYFDGDTILPQDFYSILRTKADIHTYHINSFMFKSNFEQYAKDGDELIYICFSTGLAGTYNAANIAKSELLEEYPDFNITIIDSKCASVGFGQVVLNALTLLRHGSAKEEIIRTIQFDIDHMEHVFTVETLDYLFRGGRLSRTSAIVGGLLDIKPIIEINDDGALVAIEKIRGRNKSLKRLVEMVGQRRQNPSEALMGICHGDDKESVELIKKMLNEKYGCERFIETYVGCAIGAHTGPGVIGITFIGDK